MHSWQLLGLCACDHNKRSASSMASHSVHSVHMWAVCAVFTVFTYKQFAQCSQFLQKQFAQCTVCTVFTYKQLAQCSQNVHISSLQSVHIVFTYKQLPTAHTAQCSLCTVCTEYMYGGLHNPVCRLLCTNDTVWSVYCCLHSEQCMMCAHGSPLTLYMCSICCHFLHCSLQCSVYSECV